MLLQRVYLRCFILDHVADTMRWYWSCLDRVWKICSMFAIANSLWRQSLWSPFSWSVFLSVLLACWVDMLRHNYIASTLILQNQIKSSICKVPLKQSSQRRLLWVRLHKEPSLKARLELFATIITVLEMRWQHVPNLRCRDAETARTITHGPSTWHNHVIVVSRTKPRTKGNRDDRWTDVAEVHWWSAMDAVICHQRNSTRAMLLFCSLTILCA